MYDETKTKGGQSFYVTKIVTLSVWTVTGTKQLLSGCFVLFLAILMPSGKNEDWDDQRLFDQSDLYVIPEALIYEIFGGILSSTPSSSE